MADANLSTQDLAQERPAEQRSQPVPDGPRRAAPAPGAGQHAAGPPFDPAAESFGPAAESSPELKWDIPPSGPSPQATPPAEAPGRGVSQPAAGPPVAGLTAAALSEAPAQQAGDDVALVEPAQADSFQRRWRDVQARFVDDPRNAVRSADALVAEVMQHIAGNFADQKARLEPRWTRSVETETEELRVALQQYRSFFHRLLSA